MAKIITAIVIDNTRPLEQAGFKSVAIVDFTTDVEAGKHYDMTTMTAPIGSDVYNTASSFFGNGGTEVLVAGKVCADENAVTAFLTELSMEYDFYGIVPIIQKANQRTFIDGVKVFCEGNEKLSIIEINGAVDAVMTVAEDINSDRVVLFANSSSNVTGIAGAVSGICFPRDEGSITWGNKAVTGLPSSKYLLGDESKLREENINYLTDLYGLIVTQFGRTTSGSNADITRSKDWLKNRLCEELTSVTINNDKIPYTNDGFAILSNAMNTVGVNAVNQGMLDSFSVVFPKIEEVSQNDKANRVLRNVEFIAKLSGAIETMEVTITVNL